MTTTDQLGAETSVENRLETLFVDLGRLKETDLLLLRSYWDEMDGDSRKAAWQLARKAMQDRQREPLLADARRRLATWVNDYESAYFQGPMGGSDGFPAASVREAAIPPLMDAIVATINSDTLDEANVQFLYGPLNRLYDEMRAWADERRQRRSESAT